MVLYEYLQFDAKGFLILIKEWGSSLYNTSAVINAVHEQFNENDASVLLESLALLYSYEHKYEKALAMYLRYVFIGLSIELSLQLTVFFYIAGFSTKMCSI